MVFERANNCSEAVMEWSGCIQKNWSKIGINEQWEEIVKGKVKPNRSLNLTFESKIGESDSR